MSHETPAAHLARLKVTCPLWRIWKGEHTGDYWASPPARHPQQALISAPTLAALEGKLTQAESRHET